MITPPALHFLYVRHITAAKKNDDAAGIVSSHSIRDGDARSHHTGIRGDGDNASVHSLEDEFGGEYTSAMDAATAEVLHAPPVEVDVPHGAVAVLRRMSSRAGPESDVGSHGYGHGHGHEYAHAHARSLSHVDGIASGGSMESESTAPVLATTDVDAAAAEPFVPTRPSRSGSVATVPA
jgi:hypothetical protein